MSEVLPLARDTPARMVPEGIEMVLPAGTAVRVTQALGGSFTVASARGNLFRIAAEDADALGPRAAAMAAEAARAAAAGGDLEERVWAQMRTVYDPEIPVNVVDLGLVYSCEVEPGDDGARVRVKMTLTAPGCGMGPVIADDVRHKIEALPGVAAATVEIVFDPPWDRHMISEAAQLELGLL
ncbi:MAG TPA: putative Fe-S cluster assembly protein SufT [Thermoanaerobaculia bacterium]|nr:putative Fe-S cluster assembly protein SufT [Thermoanaerobaculia bacterium]